MIKTRFNYWNCSKFANWIRGEKKPLVLAFGQWEKWKDKQKRERPLRFWLSDTLLNRLQDIVYYPSDLYHTIRVYIRNRYISKIHYLKTGLKPGSYYDFDDRILYGLFNELVIFVEQELAHLSKWEGKKKYKFVRGRSRETGLDYLNWAGQLKFDETYGYNKKDKEYNQPTSQAKDARKILELYNWWIDRDNRVNPYNVFSKEKHGKYYYRKIAKMEDDYYKEDTKKLIELIKIRSGLWI